MIHIMYAVDPIKRIVKPMSGHAVTEQDHEASSLRFAFPDNIAGTGLDSTGTAVRVMYIRPDGGDPVAKTLTFYKHSGGYYLYDWNLQKSDLSKEGGLTFSLCVFAVADGAVSVEWHTTPCQVRVLGSIHTDDSDEGDESITPTVAQRVAVLESVIRSMAGGAPVVVSDADEMVDVGQIYVLTTDGYWYYYDGTDWAAGGTYGATATDRTLSEDGIPADAKAAGDRLGVVEDDIEQISEIGTEERETVADIPALTWAQGNINANGTIGSNNRQWINCSAINTRNLQDYALELTPATGYRLGAYWSYSDGTGERSLTYTGMLTKELTGINEFRIHVSPKPAADISPSAGDGALTIKVSKVETVEVHDVVSGVRNLAREEAETAIAEYDAQKPEVIDPCLSVFPTFAVIGDSYSSGAIHFPDGGYVRRYDLSWCQQMARHFGGVCTNYTYSGIGTRGWLTNATYGLPKLLSDDPKDLYILALGINDYTQIVNGTLTLGTVEDMVSDYTQSPDSFYGNYNRIIGNIKAHAPNARIVQLSYLRPTGGGKKMLNPAFEDIADKAGIPLVYMEDDAFFTSDFYRVVTQVDGHPTAVGYAGMCTAIERLLSKCVEDNPSYFGQIGHV